MLGRQKQVLESFVRVSAFLVAHPVTGALTYAGARETLEDVVRRLREHAIAQISGGELSRGERRRQEQLVQQLLDRHIRPIVTIAQAQIEPDSDVRLPAALRMPPDGIGVTKLLLAADAMIEAARGFEATFVANAMPVDFLAQFTAARNELERVAGGRVTLKGARIGARMGLQVQMRRGRRAVARLDAVVRASFAGNLVALAMWRSAKRVQALPGGAVDPSPSAAVAVPEASAVLRAA